MIAPGETQGKPPQKNLAPRRRRGETLRLQPRLERKETGLRCEGLRFGDWLANGEYGRLAPLPIID